MVSLTTFLDFEKALSVIVSRIWKTKANELLPDLITAAKDGDTFAANQIVNQMLITDEITAKLPKVAVIMQAAMLFGSEVVNGDVKKSALMKGAPDLMPSATEAFKGMVTTGLHDLVARQTGLMIGALVSNNHDETEVIIKAELSMEEAVRDMVLGNGEMMADIASNLTTSRLVNYGALYEMHATGIASYQLEATLDQRTSQVCRRMHGKVFNVEQALTHTEKVLRTTDPQELRQAAPWIKSNKATLYQLEHLSNAELAGKGYSVPPFHPRCRTIVVPVGDAVVTGNEFTPIQMDSKITPDLLLPSKAPGKGTAPSPVLSELIPEDDYATGTDDVSWLKPND